MRARWLRDTAAALASEVRQRHSEGEIPVPIRDIATGRGAEVTERAIRPEGYSERRAGGYRIIVRPRRHAGRLRFTLAHELGHIVLDQVQRGEVEVPTDPVCLPKSEAEIEVFCHYFASVLLMPEEELTGLADWGSLTIQTALSEATRLGVSATTMLVRAVELASRDQTGAFVAFRGPHLKGSDREAQFEVERGVVPGPGSWRWIGPQDVAVQAESDLHRILEQAVQDERELLIRNVHPRMGWDIRTHHLRVLSGGSRVFSVFTPEASPRPRGRARFRRNPTGDKAADWNPRD